VKVLLLSPYPEKIERIIADAGDDVLVLRNQYQWVTARDNDFIVSYGWPFIIPPKTVQRYGNRIINIHIGYLPWNRGADPNFWSWHDDTPKGVTIHQMDDGIDTGPIIAQHGLLIRKDATLKSSYEALQKAAVGEFNDWWPIIRRGHDAVHQRPGGLSHKKKDREAIWHNFPLGWDTPVAAVEEFGRKARGEHGTESREATGA